MGRIHKSLLQTSLATYLRMAIQFVSVVVVSRLLAPEEIGIFSVTAALVALGQIFRDFGIGHYLVQEKALDERKIRTSFGVAFVASFAVAIVLWLVKEPAATFYEAAGVERVMEVLALNFMLLPIGAPAMSLLRREFKFGRLAIVQLSGAAVQAGATIWLAWSGFSYMSMAWGSVISTFATLAALWAVRAPHLFILPSLAAWREVSRFGGFACSSNLIRSLSMMAPDIVMGKLLGFDAVAYFSRAQGLTRVFSDGVQSSVAAVAQPSFAAYDRSGQGVKREYLRSVEYMTVLAWPFYGTLALFAHDVVLFLFGETWLPTVLLLQILCLRFMLHALFSFAETLLLGLGAVEMTLKKNTWVAVVRIGATIAAAFHSLEAVAWAQLGVAGVNFLVTHHYLHRRIGLRMTELLYAARRSLVVTLAALVPPAVAVFGMQASGLPAMLIAGAVVGVFWFAALALLRHPLMRELDVALGHRLRAVGIMREGRAP